MSPDPSVQSEPGRGRLRLASPRTAAVLGGLSLLLVFAAIPLELASPGTLSVNGSSDVMSDGAGVVFVLTFAAVGVVVARRQPHNPMGWLLLGAGLVWEVGRYIPGYTYLDYRGHRGELPLGHVALLFSSAFAYGLLIVPLIILLFPDGQLGHRWRWPLRAYVAICLADFAATVGVAVQDLHLRMPVDSSGNLIGLLNPPFANRFVSKTEALSLLALFGLSLSAVVYQARTYRRASGERREQLKWLGGGAAICVVALPTFIWPSAPTLVSDLLPLGLAAVPITIGVGILKYRLYEIDRLISRTLSYTLLTAMLVGVFVGIVVLMSHVLPFSSPVAVAASTLTAAALFNPLRLRTQRLIDRRFNRARYDAQATVAAFTGRLRDALDLDSISGELLRVVEQTIAPAHASLWIRPAAPVPPDPTAAT